MVDVAADRVSIAPGEHASAVTQREPSFEVGRRSVACAVEVKNRAVDGISKDSVEAWSAGRETSRGFRVDGTVSVEESGREGVPFHIFVCEAEHWHRDVDGGTRFVIGAGACKEVCRHVRSCLCKRSGLPVEATQTTRIRVDPRVCLGRRVGREQRHQPAHSVSRRFDVYVTLVASSLVPFGEGLGMKRLAERSGPRAQFGRCQSCGRLCQLGVEVVPEIRCLTVLGSDRSRSVSPFN